MIYWQRFGPTFFIQGFKNSAVLTTHKKLAKAPIAKPFI